MKLAENKPLLKAIILVCAILMTNCESDNGNLLSDSSNQFHFKSYTFEELNEKLEFQNVLESLENKGYTLAQETTSFSNKNLRRRIVVDFSRIKEIIFGDKTTYTFYVKPSKAEGKSFNNLVLQYNEAGNNKAYLITYTPDNKIKRNMSHNSFSFEGKRKIRALSANHLDLSSKMITICITWKELWCSYSTDHVAGETCSLADDGRLYWKYFTECTSMDDGSDTDSGGYSDPDESEGGGGDSTITSPVEPDCEDPIHGCDKILDDDCNTSKEDLKKVFPSTSDSRLQEIADAINKYGQDFGIDTKEKLQHFLAQAGHESANFTVLEENLNYRWEKLGTDYWEKYFNPINDPTKDPSKANPNDYKRNSSSAYVNIQKFADLVYGGRMGNNMTGDGYKYRGRGVIQLTGKHNYRNFNTYYQQNYNSNYDLINSPDLINSNIEIAVISALWYFKFNVMNTINISSTTSVARVTRKINSRLWGQKHRQELFAKTIFNIVC
jgi:putative chitinase